MTSTILSTELLEYNLVNKLGEKFWYDLFYNPGNNNELKTLSLFFKVLVNNGKQYFLFSFSMFIPTLLFQLFLIFAIISKFVLSAVKYFFERVLDDPPEKIQFFTLLSTLFTVIMVIIHFISEFVK